MKNLTTNELAKEISKNLMLTSMLQEEMRDRFKNVEGYLVIKDISNDIYIIRKNNNIVEGFGFNGKKYFRYETNIGLIMIPSYFFQITEEEYNTFEKILIVNEKKKEEEYQSFYNALLETAKNRKDIEETKYFIYSENVIHIYDIGTSDDFVPNRPLMKYIQTFDTNYKEPKKIKTTRLPTENFLSEKLLIKLTKEEYDYCANIVKKYETEKFLGLTQYLHELSKKYDII